MVTRARGFTVLELMIASAIALTIVAGAGAMLGQMVLQHRRDAEHARMRADLDLGLSRISHDLRHAGLGLPTGFVPEGEPALGPLLLAGETELVLAGDLPRPDQVLNGSSLAVPVSGGLRLGNELNEDRPTAAGTDPKHGPDEFAILVNSRGEWAQLGAALPSAFLIGPNRGFVSTPDRVFYRLEGGVLLRMQCWGPVPPQAETEPCGAGDGTGWERLASGIRLLQFEYATEAGAGLSPLPLAPQPRSKVRRVRVRLALRSAVGETTLDLAGETVVALRQ